MSYEVKAEVDAKGLICPEPVMMLHSAVRDAKPGDVIALYATDQTTKRDVTQFCEFLGHELLSLDEADGMMTFYICKAAKA